MGPLCVRVCVFVRVCVESRYGGGMSDKVLSGC